MTLTTYDDGRFLKEGQYLGFELLVGGAPAYTFWRVAQREFTNITPYNMTSVATATASAAFDEVTTAGGSRILLPRDEAIFHHMFIGVGGFVDWTGVGEMPGGSRLKLYVDYPINNPTSNIRGLRNPLTDNAYAFVRGRDTPFDDPYYESLAIQDLGPAFSIFNPTARAITPQLNFLIMRYRVEQVTDRRLLSNLYSGRIPSRIITLGGIGRVTAPEFIQRLDRKSFVQTGPSYETAITSDESGLEVVGPLGSGGKY